MTYRDHVAVILAAAGEDSDAGRAARALGEHISALLLVLGRETDIGVAAWDSPAYARAFAAEYVTSGGPP